MLSSSHSPYGQKMIKMSIAIHRISLQVSRATEPNIPGAICKEMDEHDMVTGELPRAP